ncbi:hypothetical protein [Pendulispora albinea]|uniref:Uncharacterized protein n=1 Tax=Pendulispora albinea TaxID=2741071 RepID=A0ABZ2M7G0_9BACT
MVAALGMRRASRASQRVACAFAFQAFVGIAHSVRIGGQYATASSSVIARCAEVWR